MLRNISTAGMFHGFFFPKYLLRIFGLFVINQLIYSEAYVSYKIVGGTYAEDNEFPFQASLHRSSPLGYYHTCGAVLVAPDWLLTAAHCIKLNSVNSYIIMMGSNSLDDLSEDNFYTIRMIVVKQGYNASNFNNDIALIQISQALRNMEQPIKISDSTLVQNDSAIVIGWGATEDGGSASMLLQKADVRIITREDCLQYYPDLTKSMTCAGYPEGQIDACQGDSGGPLIEIRDGEPILVGIVSWGMGCAEADHPGVYTDVAVFNSWIHHYISAK